MEADATVSEIDDQSQAKKDAKIVIGLGGQSQSEAGQSVSRIGSPLNKPEGTMSCHCV